MTKEQYKTIQEQKNKRSCDGGQCTKSLKEEWRFCQKVLVMYSRFNFDLSDWD